MDEMSEKEMLKFAEEHCNCYRCPAYISARPAEEVQAGSGHRVVKTYQPKDLGDEEIAYCIRGKGKVITKESICNCSGTGFVGCPVRSKFNFKHKFYCTRGSEM